MRNNLSFKSPAVPAVSRPSAPATPKSPKVLAGAVKVEDDGVVEEGVVENVGTLFGPNPADDEEINGETAKSGREAPSVSRPTVPFSLP